MNQMILEPDFLDHWKTQTLIRTTSSASAPLIVIRLWAHCQQRKAFRFYKMSDTALAAICRWDGDPALLRSALIDSGFLDEGKDRNGRYLEAHGWGEINAKLIANWRNGPKGGRPRKTNQNPPETQTERTGIETQPKPTRNLPKTDKRREDKIREDKNTPLKPPKGGVGDGAPKNQDEPIPPVLDTPAFGSAWSDWIAYRREKRLTTLKPRSVAAQLATLAEWGESAAIASIRQSIRQGWQGLFEPKGNRGINAVQNNDPRVGITGVRDGPAEIDANGNPILFHNFVLKKIGYWAIVGLENVFCPVEEVPAGWTIRKNK